MLPIKKKKRTRPSMWSSHSSSAICFSAVSMNSWEAIHERWKLFRFATSGVSLQRVCVSECVWLCVHLSACLSRLSSLYSELCSARIIVLYTFLLCCICESTHLKSRVMYCDAVMCYCYVSHKTHLKSRVMYWTSSMGSYLGPLS